MTNKTILLVREPNVDISEGYLRKVLAACPSGGGYSVQSKNEAGEPELITDNMDTGVALADVQELLKAYSSHRILLAFNKLDKVEDKFLQPYHVSIDGDDVLLSFGIDGHFPTMTEAGHTEESLLAQRVMFPNLQKFIKYSAGNLDKFVAELRDPTFIELVMSRIGDRGAFCFLPPVGKAIWLGKNKAGSTFPWGQTSDTLGYTETPAQAEAPAKDVKKGWWGKSKGPELPVAQDPLKVVPAAPAAPSPDPAPLEVPAASPGIPLIPPPLTPPAGKWEAIPKGLSKDQRKKLIRRVTNCGSVLPDNWNTDPFYYWVAEYPKDEQLLRLAAAQQPKDMRAPAPKPVLTLPKSGGEVDVLMMSKEERDGIETHILNVLGYNAKHATTPIERQKLESNYPPFSSEFGIKIEDINTWTPKQVRLLGSKGLTHLLLEYRRLVIEHAAGSSPATSVTSDAAPAVAASSTAPAPSAKKGYWGKSKAA